MKQTINHIVIALALLLAGNISTHAATSYGFSLGGVQVTSDNCGNIQNASRAKITIRYGLDSGTEWYARYDPGTKTLTLKNVDVGDFGNYHSGLVNTSCARLTVVFIGQCRINSKDAGAELSAETFFRSEYGMFDRNQTKIAGDGGGISVKNGAKVFFDDANIYTYDHYDDGDCGIYGGDGNGSEEVSIWSSRVEISGVYGIRKVNKLSVMESYVKIEGTKQAVDNMTTYAPDQDVKISASEGAGAVFDPEKKTFYSVATRNAATTVTLDAFHRLTTYFEDPVFRAYVNKNFDTNNDNYLTIEEAAAVTTIDVSGKGITSLDGIFLFGALSELRCNNNKISKLDLTGLPYLAELRCEQNKIEELDFSKCTRLYDVKIANNCINVENMWKLVLGLPAPKPYSDSGKAYFDVTGSLNLEGYEHDNACTRAQINAIKDKGWTVVTCTDYGLTVGGAVVSPDNFTNLVGAGGTSATGDVAEAVAYFDPSKNELHLKDVSIHNGSTTSSISLRQNKVRIVLDGGTTSLIGSSRLDCDRHDVEICGEGKLTMKPYTTAIDYVKSLTVSGKASVLIDFSEGAQTNYAIYGYALAQALDIDHNLGTLTVKEEGFIRADGPDGACLKEIGTLNLKDDCTIISPAGTTFDGQNCQFIDSEGNAVTDQPLALGKTRQIPRIYIDGFTWPQHNQLGDYEVSTQTEGVKKVVVEYREGVFDLTVIDPTHVFKAGEWPEVDFIIYPELGYEFISNGMEGTRVVVPTADNSKNSTYRYYNVPDGGRRFYFDDYMVPTPEGGLVTGIGEASLLNDNGEMINDKAGGWYSLDGRQLNRKPTQKGIYLFKGKKVVVK